MHKPNQILIINVFCRLIWRTCVTVIVNNSSCANLVYKDMLIAMNGLMDEWLLIDTIPKSDQAVKQNHNFSEYSIIHWHVNEHCMQPYSLSVSLCNGSMGRPLAELWDKFKWSGWALLPALCPGSVLQVGLLSQLQMTHAVPVRQSVPTQQASSLQVAEYLKRLQSRAVGTEKITSVNAEHHMLKL